METKKNTTQAKKNGKIYRYDVNIGVVSLVKIIDRDEEIRASIPVLDKSATKKVIALDVRKIAFIADQYYGKDLFYKLNMKTPYSYRYINETEDYLNNTFVIRKPSLMNSVLSYSGFKDVIKKSDLSKVKKVLLSSDANLHIEPHDVPLGSPITFDEVKLLNEQMELLDKFRSSKLPTTPEKIERVYAKYFK